MNAEKTGPRLQWESDGTYARIFGGALRSSSEQGRGNPSPDGLSPRGPFLAGATTRIALINGNREIAWVNDAACKSAGSPPVSLIGQKYDSLWPDLTRQCNACPVPRAFETKRSEHGLLVMSDGQVWEERAEPVLCGDGGIAGVVCIASNITEILRDQMALQESEERFRAVFETARDAIFIKNRQLCYVQVNPAMERLFGLPAGEMLGRADEDFLDAEAARHIREVDASVLDGKVIEEEGTTIVKGAAMTFHVIKVPMRDSAGEIVGLCGIARDVTERKQAADELEREQEKLRVMIEESPLGVCVVDSGGKWKYLNPKFVEMYGYTLRDVPTGRAWFRRVFPKEATRKRVIKAWISDLESSKRGQMCPRTFEVICRDGTAKVIHFKTVTVSTGDQFVLHEDITERRRAEEAYRALVDHSLQGLVIVQDECVVFANRAFAEISGYAIEELQAMSSQELVTIIHPDDRETLLVRYRERLAGHALPEHVEYRGVRKDGSVFWVEVYPSPIQYRGRPAIQAALVDITKRKRAEGERRQFEAQMRHAHKLESLGVLAGGIAHDFNNLLVGILGNVSLVMNELPKGSPARESLHVIEESAQRAAELTGQMLAYSGRGRFVVDTVVLSEFIKDMDQLIQGVVPGHISLAYELADDLPEIEVDAGQIRQAVLNLVTNAVEAIDQQEGSIHLRTGLLSADEGYLSECCGYRRLPEGAYVYLEVADTGCGMDDDTVAKVFDPFFTTKFTGRGLGLAAVLGIVRGHYGAIRVTSRPGSGATFRVLLPCKSLDTK
ncbi:MAG: PAS domain S-box protein [Phycisphaerae bacterium]|nr:PAS domain S-box protein [Phycisphaerae bacterium]